jgi:hypothetical protein
MAKPKAKWVKTDIPKDTKIRLWRIMRDNPTVAVSKKQDKYGSLSRDTYDALKYEVLHMPVGDVATLPLDLQGWVLELRPEIEYDLEEYLTEMPPELKLQLGFTAVTYLEPVVTEESITVEAKNSDGSTLYKKQYPKTLYPVREGNSVKLVSFKEFMLKFLSARAKGDDEPPSKG